jgi:cobalt-zinc-cadmium efflux system membrane fusion protein
MKHPRRPRALAGLLVALSGALLLGAGCRTAEPPATATPPAGSDDTAADEHGALRLSREQLESYAIRIAAASPGTVDPGVELLGEVRPNGDRLAHIVPRFPGIVREVRRSVGEQVRSGETLAIIESSDSLAPYELKTLIAGTILDKHLTLGEAVDRDKQAFVVADLSTVWVDLSVYQKDTSRVRLGQEVRVRSIDGASEAGGRLSYVTPAVDPLTRAATARVVLPNADGRWRPGMFVTARALEPADVPLVVPRSALQTIDGRQVVFVETDAGLVPRGIALGRQGEVQVEVVAGLAPGERVAETNTFLLKAELTKGASAHAD